MTETNEAFPTDLFPLTTDNHRFLFTGLLPDGRQFILGPDNPDAVILFFDSSGHYLDYQRQTAGFDLKPFQDEQGTIVDIPGLYDAHFRCFQTATGCHLGTIRVKPFFLAHEDLDIALCVFPGWLQEFQDHPERFQEATAEDIRYYRGLIEEWVQRGDFVFSWGNDFHVNREGIIVAS